MKRNNSRTENVYLNVIWLALCQILTTALSLISRRFFLQEMGAELLGVNSTFADILIIFSFADLGIGTAIAFGLYKPILNNDREKIKSLLAFYKKIYAFVVGALIVLFLLSIPVLLILKTDIPFKELVIYYVLFQLNNIISFICVYRETYIIALQKERTLSRFTLVFTILQIILQIVIIKTLKNYIAYLLVGVACLILRKIVVNIHIRKKYPETIIKRDTPPLEQEEKKSLFKKARSMLVHRVGNLAINQTDSIIISSVISVAIMGLVSNYILLRNTISTLLSKVYSAVLPSMGNLVAEGNEEKQIQIFNVYDFANFWIYSFSFVALASLSTPFLILLFSSDVSVDFTCIVVLFFAFFLDGLRNPVSILREASGKYEKDKWWTIVAAVVNLIVSISLAFVIGLLGIYIGTICAMLVLIISRTIILFKDYQNLSAVKYFLKMLIYTVFSAGSFALTYYICYLIQGQLGITIVSFIAMIGVVVVIPNIAICLGFCWKKEFKYLIRFVFKRKGENNNEQPQN